MIRYPLNLIFQQWNMIDFNNEEMYHWVYFTSMSLIKLNCRCDDGFYGKSCVPQDKLRNKIIKKFESPEELVKGNFDISGGSITSADEACGPVGSGSSLYFYQVSYFFGDVYYKVYRKLYQKLNSISCDMLSTFYS